MNSISKSQKFNADKDAFAQIDAPYLLVTFIPCYLDDEGEIWLDRAWYLDVVEHTTYIKNLVLCAPRLSWYSNPDFVRVEAPLKCGLTVVFLPPPQTSYGSSFGQFFSTFLTLWKVIGQVDIVHSSVIGWPYPLGWIANPVALLRGKKLIVYIESSWKIQRSGSWKQQLLDMDPIREWIAGWSCRVAKLAIFTQSDYRDVLCGNKSDQAYVIPAVWVNKEDVLDLSVAEETWSKKVSEPVRILFAGRLIKTKGVNLLLEALRVLDLKGASISVDIIGDGDLRAVCVESVMKLKSIKSSVLDPVPYGKDFFEMVKNYHAIIIPSLSDEQPRIVFDAYSQAVPVIVSDTPGLRPHVHQHETGWLLPPGDLEALVSAIELAQGAANDLMIMGLKALKLSASFTHKAMHAQRSHLIAKHCLSV